MRRKASTWKLVLLAVLVVAAAGLRAEEAPRAEEPNKEDPGPRMVIAQEVVDAGQVVRGNAATATWIIKNEGKETLKILSAKPGCGCTVASFDESIEPGMTGKISATVKTENFRGPIEKNVAVTSNDTVKGTVQLRIKAQVVGSIEFVPRPGLAFPAGTGWEWSSKLIVRKDPTETGELKISEVTPSVPWLSAKATQVTESLPAAEGLPDAVPGDWILDVAVTDDAPRTQGGFQVKLKTGLPREPEATLPISVVLQQPLRAVPNALYLPSPKGASYEAVATIDALLRPGLAKETVTATVSPAPFSVKVEPAGNKKFKATVTWKPGKDELASAPRQGAVILRVGEESVSVPVRIDPDPSVAAKAAASAAVPGAATVKH